jgi:4-amino-4-deoxy-L-arabinose transferase-like glycosyltransferase
MSLRHPTLVVLLASLVTLAVGTAATPLWDEDEARFAAIARAMVETGDWVVPMFNGTLAVDKPVLMHWCMAACMSVFGINEFAARLPSVIATLLTALALLRAGRRWFDDATGVVGALAFVGCLLVGIEAHAATPDAILTALTTWATVLAAEALMPSAPGGGSGRLTIGRGLAIGLLLGLAVVCKGPIGFVGPLAVLGPWAWWLAVARRRVAAAGGIGSLARAAAAAAVDAFVSLRPIAITCGAILAAAPWYAAVAARTNGEWIDGFFFIHNVGRFMAPMEKHGGTVFFHPLAMLVGFYPWSCFLPLAIVLVAWRLTRGKGAITSAPLVLLLVWLAVWVGGFSASATKLPNYVLPAYPAAALLVAALAVEAARRAAAGGWEHPRWLATGLGALAFGGVATAATVVAACRYGMPGGEPAALVGLVPVAAAIACLVLAGRGRPGAAVAAFTAASLAYVALAVGPAQTWLASANTLPGFVREVQSRVGGGTRLGTYLLGSPNVVFYADRQVNQIVGQRPEEAVRHLESGSDAVLLVLEPRFAEIEPLLPRGTGVIGRTRPVFRRHDLLAIGRADAPRTAATPEVTR